METKIHQLGDAKILFEYASSSPFDNIYGLGIVAVANQCRRIDASILLPSTPPALLRYIIL